MNNTVLITGGSRGIGRACVMKFAEAGYRVALVYQKSEKKAEELVRILIDSGVDACCYRCDVSSFDEVSALKHEVLKKFGRIDVIVNNAGISQIKLFTDLSENDWDRMFDVNVKGVFNVCRNFLPEMISEKRGRIINISSMWGIDGASCEVHYSAAKAAVIGFTKALARELGPSGITVNCVAPGLIDTEMNAELSPDDLNQFSEEIPLMRSGKPEEVADAVIFLASDTASYITGHVLSVNGGAVM